MPRVKQLTTTPAKPVPSTKEELREFLKQFPNFDVLDRRLNNPRDPGSLPILLKDESPDCCLNSTHQRQVKANWTTCQVRDPETGRKCGRPVRRWFIFTANTAIENKWSIMKSRAYVPVLIEELQDVGDVSDLHRQKEDDGKMFVRSGDRGQLIAMKTPLVLYNHVQAQKHDERMQAFKSKRALRQSIAEGLHGNAELGSERDEAASMVYGGQGIQIEHLSQSRTTLQAEADGE